ncbi:hypothetical protein L1987_80803 [Smallanthus sonchifolius]|uniref:Uncharacterized protein n=1 Tax=Smallanthus sonchifolius TaxID=185202 RepID=A0ACB8YN24_9ASTR|nr:hypothetical protein L1987_80803 [Smallanthus sonchifolius]
MMRDDGDEVQSATATTAVPVGYGSGGGGRRGRRGPRWRGAIVVGMQWCKEMTLARVLLDKEGGDTRCWLVGCSTVVGGLMVKNWGLGTVVYATLVACMQE